MGPRGTRSPATWWKGVAGHLPVLSSFLLLAVVVVLVLALDMDPRTEVLPADCAPCEVGAREWRVWKATVALGVAAALLLGIRGVVRLRWARRDATPAGVPGATGAPAVRYGLAALLWALFLGLLVGRVVGDNTLWSDGMELRLEVVVVLGLVSASPWVALTWSSHREVRCCRRSLDASRVGSRTTRSADSTDVDLAALAQTWDRIVSVALALATFVTVAVVPTGALRSLWLSQTGSDRTAAQLSSSFSTTDVLLYGALWALFAAVVVLPLVAAWRSTVQAVIDARVPPSSATAGDPAALATRTALLTMHRLDAGILRNPLTLLTVATPLATAALAAFVPEVVG